MTITSQKHPAGFTIMEILISISILAIGFAGIFVMMQNSIQIAQQTQTKTLAINLTREAVEIVHNIRDTNRTKRSGSPESCWLKTDPLVDNNNDGCQNDDRITAGRYSIQEKNIGNQQYFSLEKIEIAGLELQNDAIDSLTDTQLCQNSTGRSACQDTETNTNIKIARAIHITGLYHKNTNTLGGDLMICPNGNVNDSSSGLSCGGSEPKELRFCAHTHIIADKSSHIQLCSVLTNFLQ